MNKSFIHHHFCLKGNRKGLPSTTFSTKSGAGFTLVEVLVTVVIFSIVISITGGIFVSVVQCQRRVLAKQELLSETSYVIEYMSRALRMAKRDENGTCLSQAGLSYENPGGNVSKIKFINHLENDTCQEFFLEEGKLKESKEGQEFFLTSDKFQINLNSLKFNLLGESGNDEFQPRVTIFLEIQVRGDENQPKIKIQTTISQRNLDIQY